MIKLRLLSRCMGLAAVTSFITACPAFSQTAPSDPPPRTARPASPPPPPQTQAMLIYELWYVDEEPSFPGGERELLRYINSTRRYPADAYASGVSGRVICSFVIDAEGSVSEVRVVRGVEESLDREAVRIIRAMPRWHPAQISDVAVPVNYVLPIPFRL